MVRTATLEEGDLFVSPDGTLYQVVMAGSGGFRKAEPWPWLPHSWSGDVERPNAVALVPGSLLARNYPVIAEGIHLPHLTLEDFQGPDEQPGHYVFPVEQLAKLAAQLDETLSRHTGLSARKERHRWILTDGRNILRSYHYIRDDIGLSVDLAARFDEEGIQALPCAQGPSYWQYIPGWQESPVALARKPADTLESPTEVVMVETASAMLPPNVSPTSFVPEEGEGEGEEEGYPSLPLSTERLTSPRSDLSPDASASPECLESSSSPVRVVNDKRRTLSMIFSIDIGYGYTKGIGPDGVRFSFPSVIGSAEEIRFTTDLIRGVEEFPVRFENWCFFYGEQAVLQSRIQSAIFDRSRVHDTTYKMLFVASLVEMAKQMPDAKRLNVVTGLPVDFFADRPEVIRSFEGAYRVTTDRVIEFIVESVFVAPQPFGSLFRELLSESGRIVNNEIERGRIGVIDVGMYTTDFVVSDALRYVQRLSGSASVGWSKVVTQVRQALADTYALELTHPEVDRAIQEREVRVRGEALSLEALVTPAVNDLKTAVVARARDLWGAGASLDVVLVSGGGGPYIYDAIRDAYPHARLLNNAFWANAEGFYRLGQRPATFEQ